MFHLSVKPISRAAGRSATAAAAYRSGQLIVDARTGEVHDYTRKSDVVHSEILVPPGAPAWAEDRMALWNAAEAAEKRKDARVARDYEVAIPKELMRAEGIELVRDFAQGLADRYGVAVDFNVHRDELRNWDGSEKGYQGYHAHVLTSTRKLGRNGFGEKADIELSDAKRKSLGLVDGAAEIEKIRQLWEVAANRHLELANHAQRIDRRSLKDQGIDRDPTVHLGPHVTALERDGVPSRLGDLNRQVVAEGRERSEHKRVLRELGEAIDAIELKSPKREDQKPAKPKGARPSRAQTLPKLDLSGLDTIKAEQEAWEREKARQAKAAALEVAPPPVPMSLTVEILRRERERDERVRRVLAKAEARQARREEVLRKLVQARPQAPRGLLAALKEKAHQQATAAWDRARGVAWKLAQEAKHLAERLRDLARPERIKEWVQALVKPSAPAIPGRDEGLDAGAAAAGPVSVRGAPAPIRPLEPRIELERAWAQVHPLLQKDKVEPLSLIEKQQLVRGWDALAKLIDGGHRQATAQQRKGVDVTRLQAHRRVVAEVFLTLPRTEAVAQHPQLGGAYGLLALVDRQAERQGLTRLQRSQELERSRYRIAGAIEKGDALQFRSGKLETVREDVGRPAGSRDEGKEPGREPPERSR